MNEHPAPAPPPPPPRIVVLRTTTAILKQTTSIFSTRNNLLMFLLLSCILLSQRLITDLATHSLTSYIDDEPSIKSNFNRIHSPPDSTSPTTAITTTPRHRHQPFRQLTPVGILDDDFSSEDNELDHRFFGSIPKSQLKANASSFILDSVDPQSRHSNFVSGNRIRASETETVRSSKSIEITEKEEIDSSEQFDETSESKTDFQSLNRFEPEHHESTALLFPIGAFTTSYGFLVGIFVITHSFVHGVIFLLVLNNLCRRDNSFATTYFNGGLLGLIRSSNFIILKWLIMDGFSYLLSFWYFGRIEDDYSLLKIFARVIFMPYSIMVPWVKDFEKEIEGFVLAWLFVNFIVSFILTVDPWIVMADSRKNWSEVRKEGHHLLSLMIHPAINLKGFESIICGPYARLVIAQTFGNLIATAFQSFMEVYFMVAWIMYYLSVKSIDANSTGQPFGQRELEAMLEDVPI